MTLLARHLAPLLLAFVSLPAFAAPPTDAQLDELMTLMRMETMVRDMLPQVEASQRQMMEQSLEGMTLSAAERARLDRIAEGTITAVRRAMDWEKLSPMYRDIYRKTFDGDDVEAITAFYRSPAGQRLLDRMPQLMQHTLEEMQKVLVPLMEEMQAEIAASALEAAREKQAETAPAKTP